MKPDKGSYTVVVLPDPTSKPYRFSIRKSSLKFLTGFLSLVLLINAGILIHYMFLTQGVGELKGLRKETTVQKQQLQTFGSEIVDLKKQMVRLKEMDAKLRVITDIGPPSESNPILGVGGAETTGLFEMDMAMRSEELARKMEEEVKVERLQQ